MGRTKNKDAKVSRTISVRPSVEKAIKKAHKLTLTEYFEANVIQDEPVQIIIEKLNKDYPKTTLNKK